MDKILLKCSNCGTTVFCQNMQVFKDLSKRNCENAAGVFGKDYLDLSSFLCNNCRMERNKINAPSLDDYIIQDIDSFDGMCYLCYKVITSEDIIQSSLTEARIYKNKDAFQGDPVRLAVIPFFKGRGPLSSLITKTTSHLWNFRFLSHLPPSWIPLTKEEIISEYVNKYNKRIGFWNDDEVYIGEEEPSNEPS